MAYKPISRLPLLLCLLAMSGCGGGGGGGGPAEFINIKGATVEIVAEPHNLLVGDRTQITVRMFEADVNGAIIKLRYPPDIIRYVPETSILSSAGDSVSVEPLEGPDVSEEEGDEHVYLVYYFSRDSFDDSGRATLTIQLRAHEVTADVDVEVDTDAHNPELSPKKEFNIAKPLFGAEDTARLQIR